MFYVAVETYISFVCSHWPQNGRVCGSLIKSINSWLLVMRDTIYQKNNSN